MNPSAAPTCPLRSLPVSAGVPEEGLAWPQIDGLSAHEVLCFPLHKRTVVQQAALPEGGVELRLFHGVHEVSFDEPHLFGFARALAQHGRFVAREAMTWGEGHDWQEVAPLLAQLLAEGLLVREGSAEAAGRMAPAGAKGPQPSPLPAAQTTLAQDWLNCEAITQALTGRALPLGHLELVVPIFRIAHMALDADGRQVGEANVFPMPLRLDVPTDWRTCVYEGSRHLDPKPMNVTALKAMRAHWSAIMALLWQVRQAYLARYPQAARRMTLGDVECLSTLVLAVPTYALMRAEHRLRNGELHPVLSSMFRVTDGLRMATHQMLFVPVGEDTMAPDTVVTGRNVHEYAERNASFHANHGVCAGPQAMIDEFLALMVDGVLPEHARHARLPAQAEAAMADLDQAMHYGLLGLQAHVAVFSLWPLMTRAWARMDDLMNQWPVEQPPAVQALRAHLADTRVLLQQQSLHATEAWRRNREQVYEAIDAHVNTGLGRASAPSLPKRIQAQFDATAGGEALTHRIAGLLAQRLDAHTNDAALAATLALATELSQVLRQTQAIVRVASQVQSEINTLLGRRPPARPFTALDIDIHVLLQGREARRLPHLLDGLATLLDLRVNVSAQAIDIDARPAPVPDAVSLVCPHGAGE